MYPWHMEAEAIRSELVEQPQSSAVTKQFYDNFRNPKESRCLEIYIAYIHSWQARVQDIPLLGLQEKLVIPNRIIFLIRYWAALVHNGRPI